ncbi:dense granule protein gra12 [Cystoisospora suis]|uniref:Dense granule protein gra12 n=1 Tax=Cystoisospora suis TaxID=483139 RepID=A0A2C6KIB0_9APIC|nr:dense granule protein gra12 [Cystoisospora suis]
MAPQVAVGLRPYGVSSLAIAVTVLAAFFAVEHASCQVGNRTNGFKTNIVMGVPEWNRVGGACLVGKANNLVVEPGFNIEPGTIQQLTVRGPDAQLCLWLSQRIEEHNKLKVAWEKKRKEARSKLRWWQLFRRFSLWNAFFPPPKLEATVKYVDLGLAGGPANSLPWISAVFSYIPPSPHLYYDFGVFKHLVGSFSPVPGVQQKEVLLLLNPHESFNKVVSDSSPFPQQGELIDAAELFSLFSGAYHGATQADWRPSSQHYFDGGATLDLYAKDFWVSDGDCLLMSRFVVRFGMYGQGTPCDRLRTQGKFLPLAHLTNKAPLMTITFAAANFFDGELPVFTARVNSSLSRDIRGTYISWPSTMVLGVLTDPMLAGRFARAAAILTSQRWTEALTAHFSRSVV